MHNKEHHDGENPGYETQDFKGKLVFWSLALLGVIVVLCTFFVYGFFVVLENRSYTATTQPSPFASQRELPPYPRLQASPPVDLQKYMAEMRVELNKYGWVDKSAGIAQIPVDVALDIVAERGLPYGRENHHPKPKPQPAQPGAQAPASSSVPGVALSGAGH